MEGGRRVSTAADGWRRFREARCEVPALGLTLDWSRMSADEAFLDRKAPAMERAFAAMEALEKGAVANPDERRQVGHYWLRAPRLAPTPAVRKAIEETVAAVKAFAADVHAARIKPPRAARYSRLLSIGIGGSALGPMFVADALGAAPGRPAGRPLHRQHRPGRLRAGARRARRAASGDARRA